jgi:hypothetical protein
VQGEQKYRFVYTYPGGAMHYGPKIYPTKKGALEAGRLWLKNR